MALITMENVKVIKYLHGKDKEPPSQEPEAMR